MCGFVQVACQGFLVREACVNVLVGGAVFLLSPFEDLCCFSGCLMSSASIQKLFCGIYSMFGCSFDEFVGEKVFSPSYSSAILAPPLKNLLMKVKEENEKAGLKLNIQKMKIMASGPITSWQIDGETMETVADFIFGDSKITTDGDCSHEIKRCLFLGRKVMTNLDSILKSKDITLPAKVHLVKAMAFSVVVSGCEDWTIKKAECQRIDAFEL